MTRDVTQDQRYINCDEAILNALTDLLDEAYNNNNNNNNMNVSSLCARAGVTRATFYRHYPDIQTATNSLENKVFNHFVAVLKQFYTPNVQPRLLFRKLLIFAHKERGYFKSASKRHNSKVYHRIIRALYPLAAKTWGDTRGANVSRINTLDYYAYAFGITGIFGYFIIRDNADLNLVDKYVDAILEFIERNYSQHSPYIGRNQS